MRSIRRPNFSDVLIEEYCDPQGSYVVLKRVAGARLSWDGCEAGTGMPVARFPDFEAAEGFAAVYGFKIAHYPVRGRGRGRPGR